MNVLELMPISNVKEAVEWGYTPLDYFAPEERLGGPVAFQAPRERGPHPGNRGDSGFRLRAW